MMPGHVITSMTTAAARHCRGALLAAMMLSAAGSANAAGCRFELQGAGRVDRIIDGRSVRLTDGREVLLDGIEPVPNANGAQALAEILIGREVTLHGASDSPDRYGRQPAFVYLDQDRTSAQQALLARGDAVVAAGIAAPDCAAALKAAEAEARSAKRGIWSDPTFIKDAKQTNDIAAMVGQFALVEGRILSVRETGATLYLNFGQRWTRDFAVTISRRIVTRFEEAGIAVKSLESKRIRIRGWVERRRGPRIEALGVGQIELLGEN